jgi:hypothetical protein
VIPGCRSVAQVEANAMAADLDLVRGSTAPTTDTKDS